MSTATIGTNVAKGAPTVAGYIVQSVTDPAGADIDMEDIIDHNTGKRVTRLVHQVDKKINFTGIALPSTNPQTDFPLGGISSIFGTHFVDDLQIEKTRSGTRVTASLTDIGI